MGHHRRNGKTSLCLQLERAPKIEDAVGKAIAQKLSLRKQTTQSPGAGSNKKQKTVWNHNDITLLKIAMEFIFNKLEIMVSGLESKEKAGETNDCIAMACDLSKRKTYRQLITGIKENIISVFGYQEVAILFFDSNSKKLICY